MSVDSFEPQGAGAGKVASPSPGPRLLSISHVSKSFPGLKALDDVSLDVRAGEIVSIVGQNGSGKSTLVKVLAGVYPADPGAVVRGPAGDAETAPELRFIHQDLGLVDTLNTVENLDLSDAYGWRGMRPVRTRAEARAARAAVARFGGTFDVLRPVAELSAAERSLVAIARAMDNWDPTAGVLVLDEPTAALPQSEDELLFQAIRKVAAEGAGVIFISHHLDEVMDISDRVVALRDGKKVADLPVSEVDHGRLISLIAGRQVAEVKLERDRVEREVILRARNLSGGAVDDIDVELRKGEILGVAGLLGSGRDELPALLFGAKRREGGKVEVSGETLSQGPAAAIAAGVAFMPANRPREGAVMTMSVQENISLPDLSRLRRAFFRLDGSAERSEALSWAKQVGLRPPRVEQALNLFSGGNQQKVVLAKWLRTAPEVLLMDEPTQGVDVGAKAAIYELIAQAAESGTAVMIASSDTKELAALCDRVLVLRDGAIGAVAEGSTLSEEGLIAETLRTPSLSHDTATQK